MPDYHLSIPITDVRIYPRRGLPDASSPYATTQIPSDVRTGDNLISTITFDFRRVNLSQLEHAPITLIIPTVIRLHNWKESSMLDEREDDSGMVSSVGGGAELGSWFLLLSM